MARNSDNTPEKDVTLIGKVEETPDRISVGFSGPALEVIDLLKDRLEGVDTRKEAVVRAVEILYSALGKQLLVRNSDGSTSVLPVWVEEKS